MRILHTVMQYLREQQPPVIMFLHIAVLLLVLSQIIISNFIELNNGEISKHFIEYYGTWIHIITGIFLFPIFLIFAFLVIRNHGFKYFFPYLSGDYSQIKSDLRQLKQLRLPAPAAGGIASTVQGLGLGAVTLLLASGLIWFFSWRYGAPWSDIAIETHVWLTGLVAAYIIGHGGMGVLHIVYTARNQKKG